MPATLSYDNPEAYIAGDRRRALAAGTELPDRVRGAALFADISGFTALTESLVAELGAQRGAEELSRILDGLFAELLGHLHEHGGVVVYFSGDAVTCWLDGDDGTLATSCGQAMQTAIQTAGRVSLPSGRAVQLAMKVAVAVGPARRFVVGDHRVQLIDVLAGALMDDLAAAERLAAPGEVVLDETAARSLLGRVRGERRERDGRACLVLDRLLDAVALPPTPDEPDPLPEALVRPWLLPAVYERLQTGRGEFLAELRTAVPLFLRFTGLDYDDDPDAGAKLDAFVTAAQRIIDDYGGSTLQLTLGDKGAYLYAVFGAPLAHEDDTARACAAALELSTLEADHPVTGMQIGLARGRLRSGTYGHSRRRTFCCLGDAVNLAARLMSAAPSGRVYASAAVRQAAGCGYSWTRLTDLSVKGKAASVEAYALEGTARASVRARHRRHTLPMIGRDEQLALLERHLVAAADGHGQVVAITSAPGLGKSRLLVEGGRLLRERDIPAYEGEAQAFGTPTSYSVWHDIWAGALGLPAGVSAPAAHDHLLRRIAELDPSLLPRVPLLGAALGVPLPDTELTARMSPKLRKASLEALLSSLLTRLTDGGRPLAFLIEDAQWLDPLSVDLLHELARTIPELPVLIMIASRTDGDVIAPGSGIAELGEQPYFDEIALTELDDEDCRAVVAAKLRQLAAPPPDPPLEPAVPEPPQERAVPAALLELVLGRAEGNPFYLEELLTFIHEQGVDPADPAALGALDLPDSLQSLLLSRIDTLTGGPRRTIKVASVIGRMFPTPMLRAVYPELGSAPEVSTELATLRRTGLIMLERSVLDEGDQTHVFKHVITAQAAYESTPSVLRESLHERVGAYLETSAGVVEPLDQLAYHYGRSGNQDKKRDYLLRAADRARADYANAAAIDYYQRAAPLFAEAERGDILLRMGGVLELTGAWPRAESVYDETLQLAERVPDRLLASRARKALAEVARKQGRYEEAAGLLGTAREGFAALGHRAGVGEVLHLAGTLAAQQGDYEQARVQYEASLEIRRELADTDGMAALFSNLGVIAEYSGDLAAAKVLNERSLALRLETGDRWAIGVSQNNLGMIALLQADFDEAARRFTEAMRLNTEIGDRWMVAIAHNNLGNATREQGRLDAAADHLGQALEAYQRYADRWALAIVYEDIAGLAAQRGEADQALMLAGAAETLREDTGSPRSPAQDEALAAALAGPRTAVGDRAEMIIESGRALSPEVAAGLAAEACQVGS